MPETGILVHGHWISKGADILSRGQAIAAGRYQIATGGEILCPTGPAEFGQEAIGKHLQKLIEDMFHIPEPYVQALDQKNVVNTRRELVSGLLHFQSEGIYHVTDLANPAHQKRIMWLVNDMWRNPPLGLNIRNFEIGYLSTTDLLNEEESKKLLNSPAHRSFAQSEVFRLALIKHRWSSYLAEELLPDPAKAMIEALQAALVRRATV